MPTSATWSPRAGSSAPAPGSIRAPTRRSCSLPARSRSTMNSRPARRRKTSSSIRGLPTNSTPSSRRSNGPAHRPGSNQGAPQMSLPKKLKNYTVHNDGDNYVGQVKEISLSKIAAKMEGYRGGGMLGEVKVDLGLEGLEMEETYGGMVPGILRQMGAVTHDACQTRFTGAYQDDQTGAVTAGELIVRGRPEEIDPGNAQAGSDTEWKVKRALSYLRWTIGGRVEVEIDMVNCIYIAHLR